MKYLIALLIFSTICLIKGDDDSNVANQHNIQSQPLPGNIAVDEVVVESSLYIKPKPRTQLRRTRSAGFVNLGSLVPLVEHHRVKRQFGQSQAAANAAAHANHNNGPLDFGNSAANAQSQAFNAQGPSGSFGASSAGTLTQALNSNRLGTQNSAGASHALNFNLPNGKSINFASTNSFANAPGGNNANSRGSAVSVNRI